MAYENARGNLAAANSVDETQEIIVPIPQDGTDRELLYRLGGTFVGTVQAQDDQGGSFAGIGSVAFGLTGVVAVADPTAVGNYHGAIVSGAKNARLIFSAYTSGEVEVEAVLVKASA